MSLFTHWACFDCRKSFHYSPNTGEVEGRRKCPECREPTRDMGVYFEPPSRRAKKAWEIARLLAESGYGFQTEGSVAYIRKFILGSERPRVEEVRRRIEAEKRHSAELEMRQRLGRYKEQKRNRRHVRL